MTDSEDIKDVDFKANVSKQATIDGASKVRKLLIIIFVLALVVVGLRSLFLNIFDFDFSRRSDRSNLEVKELKKGKIGGLFGVGNESAGSSSALDSTDSHDLYDKDGNKIIYENGAPKKDRRGNIVKVDKDGNDIEYDADGNIIKYTKDGKMIYDKDGNFLGFVPNKDSGSKIKNKFSSSGGSSSGGSSSEGSSSSFFSKSGSMVIAVGGSEVNPVNGSSVSGSKSKKGAEEKAKSVTQRDYKPVGFGRSVSEITQAGKIAFNANYLLKKGTYIKCSLRTKVVTTVSGNVECVVSDDVYSSNGNILLIEKGSSIYGTYRGGQMKMGQDRLFVIWDEVLTTKNVLIPLQSEATDSLGASGVQGEVDNHWFQRFGSALMLSSITTALNALASNLSFADTTSTDDSTLKSSTETMATEALKQTINIQPTLTKDNGDIVGIYVNKNIDFSNVYKVIRK